MSGAADIALDVRADEIEEKPIDWVIERYLARRKLSDFQGPPGEGKTTLTYDMAAAITTGGHFRPSPAPCEGPHNVAFLDFEGDRADSFLPLLKAAGADLTRVFSLSPIVQAEDGLRPISLPEDAELLEAKLKGLDIVVLFIDPPSAMVSPKVNSNNEAALRRVLTLLMVIAEKLNIAICFVRHLNKQSSETRAINRGIGSIASNAAARFVFLVAQHPEDAQIPECLRRRVLACTKANRIRKPQSFAFRLTDAGNEGEKDPPAHIEWIVEPPCNLTADDLLREPRRHRSPDALNEAVEFLQDELLGGPRLSKEIESRAREAGISSATLRRAKEKVEVRASQRGVLRGPYWLGLGDWEKTKIEVR